MLRNAFLTGLGLVSLSSAALASPKARLVYGRTAGAESCPNEDALRRAVAARVGYDPFFPHAPRTVVVTIAPREGGLTARIQLIDDDANARGARELSSATTECAALFESTAMAIAIAIDPRVLVAPLPAPPPEGPAAPARVAPEKPNETEPNEMEPIADRASAPPRNADHTRTRLTLSTRAGAGFEPSLAMGFFAGVAAVWQRFSIGGEAGSYLPTGEPAPTGGEARGWLACASVLPCLRIEPLALCAVATAGRLEGSGHGMTTSRTRSSAFLALGARPRVELVIARPLRLQLEGEIVSNLNRATLRVGQDDVWIAPLVAGSVGIGASYEIE